MTVLWLMMAFRKAKLLLNPFPKVCFVPVLIIPTEKGNTAKTSSRYGPRTLSDILKRLSICIGDVSRCPQFRWELSRISMRG